MIAELLLLALQTTTASPVDPAPLEAGRWVFRETIEPGTGSPAISATLLSSKGAARLLVRCDLGYDRSLSIQFLPVPGSGISRSASVNLRRADDPEPMPLVWEPGPIGAFARDGDGDPSATMAASEIQATPGALRILSTNSKGEPTETEFESRRGREQLRHVLVACAPAAAQ